MKHILIVPHEGIGLLKLGMNSEQIEAAILRQYGEWASTENPRMIISSGVFVKFLKPLAAQGLWGNFAKQFENVDFSLRCNGFGGEPPEFLRKLK